VDRILELLSGRSYPFSVKVCARGEMIKKELVRIPNLGYKECLVPGSLGNVSSFPNNELP